MYTDNVSECLDDEEAQKQVHKGPTILKQLKKVRKTHVSKHLSTIVRKKRILWMYTISRKHVMKEKQIFAQFVTNNSKLVKK